MLTPYRPPKPSASPRQAALPRPPRPTPAPHDDAQALVAAHLAALPRTATAAAAAAAAAGPSAPSMPPPPFQLLEVTIISAQDLAPAARNVPTYAVAWVHPSHKLTTRVDDAGGANPTWNDKFVFRVDEEFLKSETSAVTIQIYGSCRYRRDPVIGNVRLVISSVNPGASTRFVALQVRRPSSRPQGILNVGVALLDGYMRSMPLYSTVDAAAFAYRDLMGTPEPQATAGGGAERAAVEAKGEEVLGRRGSVVVRTWSDIEQGAVETKLERWRTELPPPTPVPVEPRRCSDDEYEITISERKVRRKGRRGFGSGALSCFCEVRRHSD